MLNSDPDADDTTEDHGTSGLQTHIRRMSSLINKIDNELGRAPKDLAEVLADMAIGSFAVCAYRSNGGDLRRASELAKVFVNRFNSIHALNTELRDVSIETLVNALEDCNYTKGDKLVEALLMAKNSRR